MADTTAPKPPPPPADLAKDGRKDGAGRRLWKQIVTSRKYELRPDELVILENACRQGDRIEKLRGEAQHCSTTARGSAGQLALHPILKELRELEVSQANLLGKLKLPDDQAPADSQPRSVSARSAVQSRWGRTG
ncbi:hypothetical protein [Mycolicibacterium wolinskyi]|uniref:hypothetical protein n=1 Tax=Mycolicibacterium wolinskyi TaxID=59750 RepID=UPI00391793C4